MNTEFTSLINRKLELEDNVRDLTERCVVMVTEHVQSVLYLFREQRHTELNDVLKEQIRKLERDR